MNYEFNGEKYRNASAHQREWGEKVIAGLRLLGIEKILDLGCGDGSLSQRISELVPYGEVLGIDTSTGMIESAKKLESDNLHFLIQDINEIKFSDEFDMIFSNAALHWIKGHEKLLSNCHRSLKEKGYIRFNFAGEGNCSFFYKVIKEILSMEEYKEYFQNFEWPWYMPNLTEYKKLVIGSDFQDIHVWEENADRNFPDKDSLIKWIDQPSIVPFLKYVDEKDKKRFREQVISKMILETAQENGTYLETFRRINVLAFKK